jgi:hypothetical protein
VTITELTELFGWMSVINVAILMFSTVSLILTRRLILRLHSRLFGVREEGLAQMYVQYLANFKLAVIVLNIVPYIALKLVT